MKNTLNQIVYAKNTVEFVTVANEYCKFIEACENHTQRDFVKLALKLLPLLYLKSSILEESLEGEEIELNEETNFGTEVFVSEIEYYAIENNIKTKLADYNEYPEVFEAQNIDTNETTLCFISEDLSDIYQDLKNFTQNYRNGIEEVMYDALIEANNQYKIYWGQRLVNSLRALHNIFFNGDLSEEMESRLDEEEEEIDGDDDLPRGNSAWLKDRFADNKENPFAL